MSFQLGVYSGKNMHICILIIENILVLHNYCFRILDTFAKDNIKFDTYYNN